MTPGAASPINIPFPEKKSCRSRSQRSERKHPEIMIRKPHPSDIDEIIQVLGFFNFQRLEPVHGAPLDRAWGESFPIRNEITELDLEHGFVAEHRGRVVGFCHYRIVDGTTAKTTLISVNPEVRRHGFGKLLQEARMREAYGMGCRELVTWCEHPDSQAWYVKHFGYREVDEEPVLHRLYFFRTEDRIIWCVHYGFGEYPVQKKLVCDLNACLKKERNE